MELDRWEQIELLYHAALECEPDAREAFLNDACAGDESLRSEVAGLLAWDILSDSFIQSPAIEIAARAMAAKPPIEISTSSMGSLIVGSWIGAYQLLEPLGRGGMGEVYLALDTRLGRKVAVKLLPARFTTDAGRVRRFAREARSVSALNHPNIITIHEIGEVRTEAGDTHYLVTEYVEGATLRQRMANAPQGRLSLAEALDVAAQIAAALATAHEAGIAHRDIKPENVMVRRDCIVKVLDFGLAKLTEPASPVIDSQASTLARNSTAAGMVMGTPRYMSPEQARGEKVDVRTDIFSLGVVLYEMVTGRQPFVGATPNETIAAILRDEPPPLAECAPDAPPEMEEILSRTLSKNRDERYQAVTELLADLQRLKSRLEQDKLIHITLKSLAKRPGVWIQSADELIADLRAAYVALYGWLGARSEQPATSGAQAFMQPGPPPALPGIASFTSKVFSTLWHSRRARAIFGIALAILLAGVWMAFQWWAPSPYSPSLQARRFYEKGLNDLRDGAYYTASKAFETAISADGEQAIPHARLAEAWMELDYTDKANYELRRASMLKPARMASVDKLYLEALNQTIEHNFVAAVEIYRDILGQTPEAERAFAYLDLGRAYERNEEVEQAMSHYKQAKQRNPLYAAAPLRLGLLYSRQREYDKAAAEFAEAGRSYEALSNAEGLNEVRYQQGVLASKRELFGEARDALQKAHDKAQGDQNPSQQIAALLQLSLTYYAEGKTVPAREHARKALDLARDNDLENLKAQGLIDLGNALYLRREYEEAETHFNRALEFAGNAKGRRIEALAQLSLGRLYLRQYIKMDEAARRLENARTFFQKGGYRQEIAETISLLGQAKLQQGDYDAALRIFNEQLQRAEQANDRSHLARLHALIGRAFADQEVYPEALRHFEKSYSIYNSLGRQVDIGYALLDRSDMLWRLGRYQEARDLHAKASAVAARLDNKYGAILQARLHLVDAWMLLSERNFPQARAYGQQALALADQTAKYTAIAARYTLAVASVYAGQGREAKRLCEEALAAPMDYQNQLANARLAMAEVMLKVAKPTEALAKALQARETFAHTAQIESEWRASYLAACSSQQMNDGRAAREHAAQAESQLAALRQQWGDEAYNGYLNRQDVKFYRQRLNGINASAR
jgi:serine/threonine protein kinase/tetratricopeptide (TPR) repeat protein